MQNMARHLNSLALGEHTGRRVWIEDDEGNSQLTDKKGERECG